MNINIPLLVIYSEILPYLYTAQELTKWKVINHFFHKNIITHSPLPRICSNCQTNRFRVHFYQKKCKIAGCMAIEMIHPGEDYIASDESLVCNLGCLINYTKKLDSSE